MANIYITKEEYDAISFCSEEITSAVEGRTLQQVS